MFCFLFSTGCLAKNNPKCASKKKPRYVFSIEKEVARTQVKNQYRTGTCWCFSTVSFLESEVLRRDGPALDLSEMYIVRRTYPEKAMNYINLHGYANFSEGGQHHDVIDQLRRFGIVPEAVYPGMRIEEKRHNHGEMATVLKGMLDGVLAKQGKRVTPRWLEAFQSVLDVYLGKIPEQFSFQGKTYTPGSFASDVLKLNPDDYIELTSYTHHPFYKKCRLEIPDNWSYNNDYYNLPLDDLQRVAEHALENGFSVAWDGDVSERDYNNGHDEDEYGTGYALVPDIDYEDMTRLERKKARSDPIKEKTITQKLRQKTFLNRQTTDDHLMHIVGLARDQKGTRFYQTKNSGGVDRRNAGYVFLSDAYFRLHTMVLMVHKNALPNDIRKSLGL
jgi:bleomycin hydrolase